MSRFMSALALLTLVGIACASQKPQYRIGARQFELDKHLEDPGEALFSSLGFSEDDVKVLGKALKEVEEQHPAANAAKLWKGERIMNVIDTLALPTIDNMDIGHLTDTLMDRFNVGKGFMAKAAMSIVGLKEGSRGIGDNTDSTRVREFLEEFIPILFVSSVNPYEALSPYEIPEVRSHELLFGSQEILRAKKEVEMKMHRMQIKDDPQTRLFEALGFPHDQSLELSEALTEIEERSVTPEVRGQQMMDVINTLGIPTAENVDLGALTEVLKERFHAGRSLTDRTGAIVTDLKGGVGGQQGMEEFLEELVPQLVNSATNFYKHVETEDTRTDIYSVIKEHNKKQKMNWAPKPMFLKSDVPELDAFANLGFSEEDSARLEKYVVELRRDPATARAFKDVIKTVALPSIDNVDVSHLLTILLYKTQADKKVKLALVNGIRELKEDPAATQGQLTEDIIEPFVDFFASLYKK